MQSSPGTTATRKCPACGQWSEWNMQPTDTCRHCGALLDPDQLRRQQEKQTDTKAGFKKFTLDLIEIDPSEPFYLRGPKHIVRALQISFVAVVSFIIWLIVVVAS